MLGAANRIVDSREALAPPSPPLPLISQPCYLYKHSLGLPQASPESEMGSWGHGSQLPSECRRGNKAPKTQSVTPHQGLLSYYAVTADTTQISFWLLWRHILWVCGPLCLFFLLFGAPNPVCVFLKVAMSSCPSAP